MTLQLALKAVVNDLTAAPAAGEPPPEPAPGRPIRPRPRSPQARA